MLMTPENANSTSPSIGFYIDWLIGTKYVGVGCCWLWAGLIFVCLSKGLLRRL